MSLARHRVAGLLLILPFSAQLVWGGHLYTPVPEGHFFLPSRTLFFFRPELFFYDQRDYRPDPRFRYRVHRPRYPRAGFSETGRSPASRQVYPLVLRGEVRTEMVQANMGRMQLKVIPSRALVLVDGKLIGSGGDFSSERDQYSLLDGDHRLQIQLPGYQPFDSELSIQPNRTVHLEIQLQPLETSR